jgi:hypothetical protein
MVDYRAVHERLVKKLREVGVHHGLSDRLPLAFYRQYINKIPGDPGKIYEIELLIDECIVMRREGNESEHKDDRYT